MGGGLLLLGKERRGRMGGWRPNAREGGGWRLHKREGIRGWAARVRGLGGGGG
jgi:hypothetical protein